MTESKFVLLSRTIAAQVLAIMAALNMLAADNGIHLPAMLAYINQHNADLVGMIVAQLAAIYFRFIATQELTVAPAPVEPTA